MSRRAVPSQAPLHASPLLHEGGRRPARLNKRGGDDPTLERIRERLRGTTRDEKRLRVLLVLCHELVRARLEGNRADSPDKDQLEAVSSAAEPRSGPSDYDGLVSRIHETVRANVPVGAKTLVVSRGDSRLLVPGYDAAHFPQGRDGRYAGFYPADSETAVAHLKELRSAGAEFFVIPATATWWLEYYADLARYLLTTARAVTHDPYCLVFDLKGAEDEGYSDL